MDVIVLKHSGMSESGTEGEVKYGRLYKLSSSVNPVNISVS